MHYHSFLFSVMCKRSYLNEDELKSRRKKVVVTSSSSSSQVTTPKKVISSPSSSSTSRREISTTFFSSPRSPRFSSSPRPSQSAWVVKDDARSGGSSPRIFLPQLKRGKLKRRVTIGSTLSESSGSGDAEEVDWPPFADEDYIVFCFEGGGAFHVVMEESPKSTSQKFHCEEHGNLTCACSDETRSVNMLKISNRRDCLLTNKETEKELDSRDLNPKLCVDVGDYLLVHKFTLENESTESLECRNGSVESINSSQSDDEQLENENTSPVELSSNLRDLTDQGDEDNNTLPAFNGDCLLPNSNTVVDEEDKSLSSKPEMATMLTINELLKMDDDVSSVESEQSKGLNESESRGEWDHEDQLEGNEVVSESAKTSVSKQSNISSDSFKFPVLEGEWNGSPVMWQSPRKVHYRRRKVQPACLRCCKF